MFVKGKNLLQNLQHPIILAGLLGQAALLYSAIATSPKKYITMFGIGFLGVVVLLILLAGSLSTNINMIASTLPFLLLATIYFVRLKRQKKNLKPA